MYWTFSYSPVKDESGLPAGVFVACTETTEKVNNLNKIAESNSQLNFAIEATNLSTWDYNPITHKFICNNRLKDWFGITTGEEFDVSLGINVIAEKDRSRVLQAIDRAMEYESGGVYDIEYSIINPITKQERILRAKGKVWFGDDKKACRFPGTLQDITHEAIARRKIEESEQRFRNLIWQAPVIIATYRGPSYIIETINKSAVEAWGKPYKEVINKPLFEMAPELEAGLTTILNDIYATGKPFINNEIALQIKRPGKPDTAYFNMLYQPLLDVDNKIYAIMLIGTEVTETVIARKQIEASEKRFSNILSQSIMAIGILKGPEMIIAFANEPFIATWRKGSDIIGKTVMEIMPEMKGQGFTEMLQRVYTTGVPYYGYEEKTINIQNGIALEFYYNVVMQPYTEIDNTITGITILATEVTDQVLAKKLVLESEAKFRILSESIPHMIWTATPDGKKNFFNQYHLDYTGLSFEELKGDGWLRTNHPDDKKNAIEHWQHTLETGEDYKIEKRICRHDGIYRWHLSQCIAQKDKEGNITGLIGTNTDIEEQKIKEQKKDEFIGIASHEMKTPLTVAKAYLQLIQTNLK